MLTREVETSKDRETRKLSRPDWALVGLLVITIIYMMILVVQTFVHIMPAAGRSNFSIDVRTGDLLCQNGGFPPRPCPWERLWTPGG